MDRLLPRLALTSDESAPLLISAVTGMGGIGKTALAVEAAHRAWAEGWFPGGFLFVDLRGYDDDPATADQGVVALLDALGVRGTDLPPTTARQYDVYRSLLTERRDPTLLILDNASDPSQYLPLLPGTDHHRVLITSRDRPDALPVRVIDLAALGPDESAALITRALHDADERDDRPAREPEALHELTALCGHLPLALQIAAAMLRRRRHGHRGIASLVEEIRAAGDPTTALDNGSPGTDLYGRSLALRPVLETSYRRLPDDQARLLRLLSLAPDSETTTEAVTVLADGDTTSVLSLLEDLAATHLVAPVGNDQARSSMPRWRLHDLVRAYGTGVVAGDAELQEEGNEARERLLAHYRHWADAADERLRWIPGRQEPERFATRTGALAWLDIERSGLVAAVLWASEERFGPVAVDLAGCLAVYLEWRRHFDDWLIIAQAACQAACRTDDVNRQGIAWNNLGITLREAGRTEEAIEAHTRARDLYRIIENREREGTALMNLGIALRRSGQVKEAVEALTQARDLYEAPGYRHREASALNNLGLALAASGRTDEATAALARARDLYQAIGDRYRESIAWMNLGTVLRGSDQVDEAITAYAESLEIRLEFEDWYGAGLTLENLGHAHKSANAAVWARSHYLQASDAYTRANAPAEAARARSAADETDPPPP
ncbi:tetratricopeptide repeat protein [Streptomyces sp. DSM 3412]|uniref:Tetratricopeptide repeat protein n=1 Tax=Streptomyces gottesmaniae TaxID=3075518 RepID=A0ABU2ZF93_9ACTN|nr:tetratricopeptide repeat protein [Streptomyces sp. DSM 3412]MDT0574082.1 tetratricopeptide repeat protein [Streptomyces sp. DSM 3412]